ncbi:MAG: DUF2207 domain-containing protein, partial [Bacillota bacterium]|nr:DUF2207 domain-containing protein [Bacillota bacterium]
MRSNHKSLVVSIMIVFLWLLYPSEGIKAVDRALVIKQYDVNAQIQSSGDMLVEEDIKFVFNGNYNGVTKQILLPEASGIENISVSQEGKNYKKASLAEKGDSGVFTLENNPDNSCMIWIYTPSANTTRSFKISYTLKNACRKYMDTGEL